MSFSLKVFSRAPIDWHRIGRAVEHYRRCGFVYVETPWRVTDEIFAATSPQDAAPFRCDVASGRPAVLVGSAEQGLLTLMPGLKPGFYMSVSPCFRDKKHDELHFTDFMKVELCAVRGGGDTATVPPLFQNRPDKMLVALAKSFFNDEGLHVAVLNTDIGVDLVTPQGIEVGSYGCRERTIDNGHDCVWAYGTGLAEPRFSQALAKQRGSL